MTRPIQEQILALHPAARLIDELKSGGYHILDSSYSVSPEASAIHTDPWGHQFVEQRPRPITLQLRLIYTVESILKAKSKAVVSAPPASDSLLGWLNALQHALSCGHNQMNDVLKNKIILPDRSEWLVTNLKINTKPRHAYELDLTMQGGVEVPVSVDIKINPNGTVPYAQANAVIDAEITNRIKERLLLHTATGKDLDRIAEQWGVVRTGDPTAEVVYRESDAELRERIQLLARTPLEKPTTFTVYPTPPEPSPLRAQLRARRGKAFWSGPTPKRIPGDYDPITGETGKEKAQREYKAGKVTLEFNGTPVPTDPWGGIIHSGVPIQPLECKPLTKDRFEEMQKLIQEQSMKPPVAFILPPEHSNCRSVVNAEPFGTYKLTPSVIQNDLMGFTNNQGEQWFKGIEVKLDTDNMIVRVWLHVLPRFDNAGYRRIIRQQVEEYGKQVVPAGIAFDVTFAS